MSDQTWANTEWGNELLRQLSKMEFVHGISVCGVSIAKRKKEAHIKSIKRIRWKEDKATPSISKNNFNQMALGGQELTGSLENSKNQSQLQQPNVNHVPIDSTEMDVPLHHELLIKTEEEAKTAIAECSPDDTRTGMVH